MRKISFLIVFIIVSVFLNFKCLEKAVTNYSLNFYEVKVEDSLNGELFLYLDIEIPKGYIKNGSEMIISPIIINDEGDFLKEINITLNKSKPKYSGKYRIKENTVGLKVKGFYHEKRGIGQLPEITFDKSENWKPNWEH